MIRNPMIADMSTSDLIHAGIAALQRAHNQASGAWAQIAQAYFAAAKMQADHPHLYAEVAKSMREYR